MHHLRCWLLLSIIMVPCLGPAALAQDRAAEVRSLSAVLQSSAPHAEKLSACKRLALVGGKESVAVLAPLLTDEKLSHPARLALEAIPDAEAVAVLRNALGKLKGPLLVGAINSLGARRDPAPTGDLANRLTDSDAEVVLAAAVALGKIGTAEAAAALLKILPGPPGARPAIGAACLRAAEEARLNGNRPLAAQLCRAVRNAEMPVHLKSAATRGEILAVFPGGVELLTAQFQAKEYSAFAVAVGVSREMPGTEVTAVMVKQLPALSPDRQAQLLGVLADRKDPAARASVVERARSGPQPVRTAALRALGKLGDSSTVPLLFEAAGMPDAALSAAAQDALVEMGGPEVDRALARLLEKAQGPARRFTLELAGRRRIAGAVPALVQAADDPDAAVRLTAIRGLERTAGAAELPALSKRLSAAAGDNERAAVENAMRAVCRRSSDPQPCTDRLLACLAGAKDGLKPFYIELLGLAGGPGALKAVSAAASVPALQDAATQALGTWRTADAAPVLLDLARKATEEKYRSRALRGYLRIARQVKMPDDQRLAMCHDAMSLAKRDEERVLALGALARIGSSKALSEAMKHLKTPGLQEAAAAACVAIAEKLAAKDPKRVAEALPRVLEAAKSPDVLRRARDLRAGIKSVPDRNRP